MAGSLPSWRVGLSQALDLPAQHFDGGCQAATERSLDVGFQAPLFASQ
jgi:hypothetical protein